MFGLRPWLAFFRRTEAFFLEVRFDIATEDTGGGVVDSRRCAPRAPVGAAQPAAGASRRPSSFVVVDQLRMVICWYSGVPMMALRRLCVRRSLSRSK